MCLCVCVCVLREHLRTFLLNWTQCRFSSPGLAFATLGCNKIQSQDTNKIQSNRFDSRALSPSSDRVSESLSSTKLCKLKEYVVKKSYVSLGKSRAFDRTIGVALRPASFNIVANGLSNTSHKFFSLRYHLSPDKKQ